MSPNTRPSIRLVAIASALLLPPLLTVSACGDDSDTGASANGGAGGTSAQQGVGGTGGSLFGNGGGPGSSTGIGGGGGEGNAGSGGEGQVGFVWDNVYSGAGAAFVQDVAVDAAGNAVVVGAFNGAFDFGGGTLTSSGGGNDTNVFAAKYNSAGTFIWARKFGSGDPQSASAVAVDAQGNVALCGRFRGSLNFGGGTLTNGNQFSNIFVAKLMPDGTGHIFSMDFQNVVGTTDECFDLAFDSAGALWATGWYQNEVDFGGGTITATGGAGDRDIFLAKFGPGGAHLASTGFGGTDWQVGLGLAAAPNGDIAVVGYSDGDVDFGNGNIANTAGQRAFVGRFNSSAQPSGGQIFTGDGVATAMAAAYDGAGDLYVGGNFKSSINFGNQAVTAQGGGDDVFVARFASDGGLEYGIGLGGQSAEQLKGLAVDSQGYVLLAGRYNGNFPFNSSTTLTSAGAFDGFVIKLGPEGNPFAAFGFGDAEGQEASGIAVGSNDRIVLVGNVSGTFDLGSGSVGPFSQDIFVAKYGE